MAFESDHTFVFVCGLHRSGTSLLFQVLREHPSISGFKDTGVPEDEGQHLQSVFLPANAYGGAGRFALDEESYLDENSALATPANAERLFGEWSKHWDVNRSHLLEKSPPNLVRTRFLQALYPKSRFVVITRHPIAVSLATQKWSKTTYKELLRNWLAGHERFEADRGHLEHVHLIKYEDLVLTPDETLGGVYDFLGLDPAPHEIEVKSDINAKYFDKWEALRGRFLMRLDMNSYEKRNRERFAHWGYRLDTRNPMV